MTFWDKEYVSDKDKRIKNLIINPDGKEERYIGSDTDRDILYGERTLFAATDFFVKKLYTGHHGLHLFEDCKDGRVTCQMGYIAQWCVLEQDENYPVPPYGWMPLWKSGEMYELIDFETDKHAHDATVKHNILDMFFLNYRVVVRVLHKQELAQSAMRIWGAKSKKVQAEELQKGAIALAGKIATDTVMGKIAERKAKRQNREYRPSKRIRATGTQILVKDDAPMNLEEMKSGWYVIYNARGVRQSVENYVPGRTDHYFKGLIANGWMVSAEPEYS